MSNLMELVEEETPAPPTASTSSGCSIGSTSTAADSAVMSPSVEVDEDEPPLIISTQDEHEDSPTPSTSNRLDETTDTEEEDDVDDDDDRLIIDTEQVSPSNKLLINGTRICNLIKPSTNGIVSEEEQDLDDDDEEVEDTIFSAANRATGNTSTAIRLSPSSCSSERSNSSREDCLVRPISLKAKSAVASNNIENSTLNDTNIGKGM